MLGVRDAPAGNLMQLEQGYLGCLHSERRNPLALQVAVPVVGILGVLGWIVCA
jgi:hypothetical protein